MKITKTLTENLNEGRLVNRPLIIAGPCSAESPDQLLEAAKLLKSDGRTQYFRAGVWKPRTTAGTFEGMGVEALKWLADVRSETGLPVATEVANERHVYESLKYGVDLLWIGARTVSDPFAVQEIADAVKGVDIPVLLKNPLAPDVDLWEGAINRFRRVGVTQVGAIHRGFKWWGKSIFRNQPQWDVPAVLKERMPDIPIICDPSHIAGRSDLVSVIARRGLDNGFNGLMIEVHPTPESALSDAKQQLTPPDFISLLNSLESESKVEGVPAELLTELRSEVDIIDDLLLWALANRMDLSAQIAGIKSAYDIPVLQRGRWGQVLERVMETGGVKGLRPDFIKSLFNSIHKESCLVQQNIKLQHSSKSHNKGGV